MRVIIITLLLAGAHIAVAGDEQWDDGVLGTGGAGAWDLVIYRNEVYGSRIKWNGKTLSRWTAGNAGFVKAVRANDLIVSGIASSMHGLPAPVSRWDGTNWNEVAYNVGVDDFGHSIEALAFVGDTLYAAGHLDEWEFSSVVQLSGTNWIEVGGGVTFFQPSPTGDPGYVWDMAVHRGQLYVAGEFQFAGGTATTNLARWDGTNWTGFGWSLGPVYDIAFQGDDLYVNVGGLLKLSGTNRTVIGAVEGELGRRSALTVHGNDVYIGGRFTSVNGVAATNIARWDGTNWWPLGSGVSGDQFARVIDIAVWNNQVIVSGLFDKAGGKPSTNFAVWHLPAPDINVTTNQVEVSWWKGFTNYVLEATDTLPASNWTPVAVQPNTNYYSAPASGPKRFFRLRQE